ncbi:MAG: MogA/MoaB family molybdenum cofactor biosynthesis protein [Dehalococcoidia bacterium]|nr:MogA/MoaB family molybdenum cofactor biosynthesis protein [Dehalococcoidia bacterium]
MEEINKRKALIIVLSDLGSQGKREDTAGASVKMILENHSFNIIKKIIIPDDYQTLVNLLIDSTIESFKNVDMILTIGGTGLSPRDITPQATKDILDLEIPGISELIRIKGYEFNHFSILSRSIAGVRNKVLIINLPGSLKGATESLNIIVDQLEHLLTQIQGVIDAEHKELNSES